ncbi:MAG: SMI1/KNR4 family protein [Deltaproteobacteria bacterium]|nr:SMI1/KNR4 family protein [Deltaproteobacteria bacterium]
MDDWRAAIVELIHLQQAVNEADRSGLWQWHLPEVAASADELEAAEARLGYALDPGLRGFLRFANGWKRFCQTIDLFGTKELCDVDRMKLVRRQLVEALPPDLLSSVAEDAESLQPIAAAEHDKDVFVAPVSHRRMSGTIIWLAGEEVDRFGSFDEFFGSMVEYNRRVLRRLLEPEAL